MDFPSQPTWLRPFKGSNHSFLDCEVLALEKIEPSLIAADWNAQSTVWFDYARLHPVKAFYYFANCYSVAYGRYLEQNIDMDLRFSRGLKGDPLDSRELKQLLAIKRAADQRGIPYGFWLEELFRFFAANGWTRPPRPSHMAANADAQTQAEEAWNDRLASYTRYPDDPWFNVESWCGHEHQARFENWLVECIKLRQHKELAIAVCVYEKGILRVERAIQEFGPLVLQSQTWHESSTFR